MSSTTKQCHCFVKHANSSEEKRKIGEQLEYFRSVGDSWGIMMSLAQLRGCPKEDTK